MARRWTLGLSYKKKIQDETYDNIMIYIKKNLLFLSHRRWVGVGESAEWRVSGEEVCGDRRERRLGL